MPLTTTVKSFKNKGKRHHKNTRALQLLAMLESRNLCFSGEPDGQGLALALVAVPDAESEDSQTLDEGRGLEYGNKVLAERLMRARLAAGFRSAKAAATEHGWKVNTYKGLEIAQRPLTPERCAAHAKAFGVPVEWLADESAGLIVPETLPPIERRRLRLMETFPLHDILPTVLALAGGSPWEGQDSRLRASRLMAGLKTASQAAAYLGIPRSSYACHENGQNRLTPLSARLYALAYGVEFEWLFHGAGRSGLPTSGAWPEARWLGDLSDLEGSPRPDPSRLAAPEKIARSVTLLQLRPLWLAVSDTMSSIPQIGCDGSGALSILTHWSLPRQAVGRLVLNDDAMLVIVEPQSKEGSPARGGDPVLVDVSNRTGEGGRQLVSARDGKFVVHHAVPDEQPDAALGSVVGRLLTQS